ncbi:MAG: hypothetical protein ACRDJ9_13215 [Dehalococcoidia bacterium]
MAPWLQPFLSPRLVVIGVNWVWAALLPLLLLPDEPLLIGVIGGATAAIGPLWNVVVGTYFLTLVPNHLLGRVRSTTSLVAWGAVPLGSLIGGLLLEGFGVVATIWTLGGLMLALAIGSLASPSVRHAPPLPS